MATKAKAAGCKAAVALSDTGQGLQRVEVLLHELSKHLCGSGEHEAVLRSALHGGIAEEVDRLLEEIDAAEVR